MDREAELAQLIEKWKSSRPGRTTSGGMVHTRNSWDERADWWVRNFDRPSGLERSNARLTETARYLREKGQLQGNHTVIDVGCGPGYYVAEFAKTAGHAMGVDISDKMLDYAKQHAASLGISNVSYKRIEFPAEADLEREGWLNAFDLVFTSITPAFSGIEALHKVNAMSRGYCFNSGWVRKKNSVRNELSRRIYGKPDEKEDTRDSVIALYDILRLLDCSPELTYYEEKSDDKLPVNEELISFFARNIAPADEVTDELIKSVEKEICSMSEDGYLREQIESIYGWILWRAPE